MARRKNNNSLGLIVFLPVILAYIFPPIFLGILVWYEWRLRSVKANMVFDGFQERNALIKWFNAMHDKRDAVLSEEYQIYERGHDNGMATRLDGRFDGRSKEGKKLNIALAEIELVGVDLWETISGASTIIAAAYAARVTVGIWVVATSIFLLDSEFLDASAKASLFALPIGAICFVVIRSRLRSGETRNEVGRDVAPDHQES